MECQKKKDYLSGNYSGIDSVEATIKASEEGYSVTYMDISCDKCIDEIYLNLSEDEKRKWMVKTAEIKSEDNALELQVYFIGDVVVPNVVGLSLSNAILTLQDLKFSAITYNSDDSSSIWDKNNWEVISQSKSGGDTAKANDEIVLTVKHYESDNPANNVDDANNNQDVEAKNKNIAELNKALYDDRGIKLVLTSVEQKVFLGQVTSVVFDFEITNNYSHEILVTADNIAVNGYQLDSLGLYATVGKGLKSKDSLTVYSSELEDQGISGFGSMETFGFDMEIIDYETF